MRRKQEFVRNGVSMGREGPSTEREEVGMCQGAEVMTRGIQREVAAGEFPEEQQPRCFSSTWAGL